VQGIGAVGGQPHSVSGICFGAAPLHVAYSGGGGNANTSTPNTPGTPSSNATHAANISSSSSSSNRTSAGTSFQVTVVKLDGATGSNNTAAAAGRWPVKLAVGVTSIDPAAIGTLPPSSRQLEAAWMLYDGVWLHDGDVVKTSMGADARSSISERMNRIVAGDRLELVVDAAAAGGSRATGAVRLVFKLNGAEMTSIVVQMSAGVNLYPVIDVRAGNAKIMLAANVGACAGADAKAKAGDGARAGAGADDMHVIESLLALPADGSAGFEGAGAGAEAERDFGMELVVSLAEHAVGSAPALIPTLLSAAMDVLMRLVRDRTGVGAGRGSGTGDGARNVGGILIACDAKTRTTSASSMNRRAPAPPHTPATASGRTFDQIERVLKAVQVGRVSVCFGSACVFALCFAGRSGIGSHPWVHPTPRALSLSLSLSLSFSLSRALSLSRSP
jgi:hypothetical protein